MVELDLGKVVMDSYNDLDNKPKINEVELSGNKTLEDLGIQQLIDAVNVSRLSKDVFAPSFETLEDFVVATATDVSVPHFGRMYINTRNWGFGTAQTRYLIAYMRAYTEGVGDVLGNGIFWDDTNTMWHVAIHGSIGNLHIQYYKIEPNQIPTNNLLATVAGTALDAVQGKVLKDETIKINPTRFSGNNVETVEELLELFAKDISNIYSASLIKDMGGWGPTGYVTEWYAIDCFAQNQYVENQTYETSIRGIMYTGNGIPYNFRFAGRKGGETVKVIRKIVLEGDTHTSMLKVIGSGDFETIANSVEINKKLHCRLHGKSITGMPSEDMYTCEITALSDVTVLAIAYNISNGDMYSNTKAAGTWKGWKRKTTTIS